MDLEIPLKFSNVILTFQSPSITFLQMPISPRVRVPTAKTMTVITLLLFSVGAGLLSLVVYRMVSLLGVPTGFFLLVFLGGMPLGAIVGLRW